MYSNGTRYSFLILCCFLSLSVVAKDAKTTDAQGLRKPLCFVENKGQVKDQDNNQRNDIQYSLSTPGLSMYVGKGQLHYQFKKVEGKDAATLKVSGYRMDVTLLGANVNATAIPSEKRDYYETYINSQQTGNGLTVHSYDKIIYKNIYPHIDWVLYVKDDKVEYDFVVNAGGNPKDIRLKYDGATALRLANDGSINAETPMGNVQEHRPYAFEKNTGKAVAADFIVKNDIISFKTGDYRGTLTIDPYLLFSTYFGGTAEDVVTSVKETTSGVTFAGGYTASTGVGTAGTPHATYIGGTYDAFLAKYDATGALKFVSYYGGLFNDQATCIALDNTGGGNPNIYLAGYTNSTSLGVAPPPVAGFHGLNEGFIAKFNNTGTTVLWQTYFGGTKDDYIYGITCDAANNVYITGQTASTGLSVGVVYQTTMNGVYDAFVAKLNGAAGTVAWSTYYGGSAQDAGYAIAVDASNNVFITGQTNSVSGIYGAGGLDASLSGTNDAFVAKFNSTGANLLWGTYFGGTGEEQGNGIVCNNATGDVAVVGSTTSPTGSGIATANAYQTVYGGGPQDAFVAYFNNAGGLTWSTYYGGFAPEYGQGICLDPLGNVIFTGGTFSTTGIASPAGTFSAGEYQSSIGGDYDAFIAKFNVLGQRLWGSYFGGLLYDYANAVDCDANYQITIGGFTTDNLTYGLAGGIATAGAAKGSNSGGTYDGFITKFRPDTLVEIAQPFYDTLVCAGGNLNVSYSTNLSFQPGNVFTIQLSDFTGSFASPVNIGSIAATTSGSVPCVIPTGTIALPGYRVRVVSSNPVYISADDNVSIRVIASLPHPTLSGTSPVCVGGSITLGDVATYTISGYNWSGPSGSGFFGTGFTSTLASPTNFGLSGGGVTVADSGLYYVVTSHNGCPDNTDSINIVVNDVFPPMPTDSAATINCDGSDLHLYSNPDTTASGISYFWIGPAGFSSTLRNPVILAANSSNAGTYFVYDVLGGCPSPTNNLTITITPTIADSLTITAVPGDTICGGTMVSFAVKAYNSGFTPTYQWMSDAFVPITGAISSTFASPSLIDGETIFCVMTSSVICPLPKTAVSNKIKMNVITNPPVAAITASPSAFVPVGGTITLTSSVYNEGIGALYQWKRNGVNIPGATSSVLVLPAVVHNDTISMELTSTMKCATPDTAISNAIIIGTNLGVANVVPSLENIDLFPNPNNGGFTVKGDFEGMNTNQLSFEVLNPVGQVLYRDNTTVQNNVINKAITLDNMPDGIYLLHIYNDEQSKTIRFSVHR